MNKLGRGLIKVGSPIPFDCYDGQGHLLLKKGLVVDSQKQVDFLLERGLYRQDGHRGDGGESSAEDDATPFQLLDDLGMRLRKLFAEAEAAISAGGHQDQAAFPARFLKLAAEVQQLCRQDADAALGAVHLVAGERYSIAHPLHRAIVCELLAKRHGMLRADRQRLIAAALSCDLAMVQLQDELSRQVGPLRAEQRQAVATHPEATAGTLRMLGIDDAEWIDAVAQHHELLDGTGYPQGLAGEQVGEWARIVKLADMYTAMVGAGTYRKAVLSKMAMRDIFLRRDGEVDGKLAVSIVKELGVYPPGAFVRLQNGEIAIVIARGANVRAPGVKAVVGPRGAPFDKPVPRRTDVRECEIVDVVERDPIVVVDMHKLWGYSK